MTIARHMPNQGNYRRRNLALFWLEIRKFEFGELRIAKRSCHSQAKNEYPPDDAAGTDFATGL